jgi:nicotinamide-nucleotide amidase
MNATIITIGDELLIGQTIDTNSAFIARQFNKIGVSIRQRMAIADDATEIVRWLEFGLKESDILVFTGGLGPTKDDITKKTFAKYFGVGMKRDIQTYEHVKYIFESRNRPFLEINEQQADIPSNGEVLFNKMGTAPGMWFEVDGKIVVSLPGVPFEMEYLMTERVIPKIFAKQYATPLYHRHIQTASMGESFLATKIETIENELPANVKLAYLPSIFRVNLRLSGHENDKALIDSYFEKIKNTVADYVYGFTEQSIFEHLFARLKATHTTLSFAESCTGGFLANAMTEFSGSSEVFKGSYVVYSDTWKSNILGVNPQIIAEYGVYSSQCVADMHRALLEKSGADFAIATSGIVEPTPESKKVEAYIAVGNKDRVIIKKIDLIYNRSKNKEAIAVSACFYLLKEFLAD